MLLVWLLLLDPRYLVKWRGLPYCEATYETAAELEAVGQGHHVKEFQVSVSCGFWKSGSAAGGGGEPGASCRHALGCFLRSRASFPAARAVGKPKLQERKRRVSNRAKLFVPHLTFRLGVAFAFLGCRSASGAFWSRARRLMRSAACLRSRATAPWTLNLTT